MKKINLSRTLLRRVLGLLTALCAFTHPSMAQDQSYVVRGLSRPAEIIVDEWGVPHIYAATHYDAFFVQGFNAARDRLWQIDLWRRRGLGHLAEVLGETYVPQDRAARQFLYRGDMYREWLAYGSDAKGIAQSFTAGINAYIELLDTDEELLPPEFELLGYRPSKWQADDVVRIRSHGLALNVGREVRRAQIACQLGLDAAAHWKVLEPEWTTTVPEGLDPCVIPADVLDTYRLARAPVMFQDPELALSAGRLLSSDRDAGSNNWAVAPSRTSTGRAILASDPHRGHAVPSLRYITHLVAPELNVIGAGEPALPGISIGHNDRIAFGLTIFPIDQEDLYVYERRENEYRYGNEWQPFEVITETLAIKDQSGVEVELKFTRHGPVVFENEEYAFAVRAAWLDEGMAPYFGSIEYMRAENWREFRAALNRWGAPPENQVYADVEGNIGYKPAGLFPRRPNWDGLLPVPGDGRYEWNGYHDMDVLPEEYNPNRGFTGTANSMNLPPDYPIAEYRIGFEWAAPWRYNRLWEVLSEQSAHTTDDSTALQRDYHSVLAREVLSLLPNDVESPAIDLLTGWDAVLTPDSAAAALYAIWYYRHLDSALANVLEPDDPELIRPLDSLAVLTIMAEPRVKRAVIDSLAAAYEEAETLFGRDPVNWRWGRLHRIEFEHPLLDRAPTELAKLMRYPAYERGGSTNTTNDTGSRSGSYLVNSGASFRMVLDVGNWDEALMTNAPGQSGDPRSPFYRNLLQGWAEDGSFPLLYSRDRVLEHEAFSIQLEPAEAPEQ